MTKPAERSRRSPRRRAGALSDGCVRQGRDRRAGRVRGVLDRPRGRGHRVPAVRYGLFPRASSSGVVENQRAIDLKIDAALARRLAAATGRGGAAGHPAGRRLRAHVPQGRPGPGRHHRICRRRPRLLWRGRAGLVNAVLDSLARDVAAGRARKTSGRPAERVGGPVSASRLDIARSCRHDPANVAAASLRGPI